MKNTTMFSLLTTAALLAACGQSPDQAASRDQSRTSEMTENTYVVLEQDLQQLKDDFNDNEGRVRLLFLSGPTCGICLRGMADLNDEFIAAAQNDDRLVTFVVHVPTLGAKEEHVADTIPLLDGPRVLHYWEDSGIIGNHFRDVMDVDLYVWDFWAIYGPEARWEGALPPKPDYYEHQLAGLLGRSGGFPREKVLDAERFAARASEYIGRVEPSQFAIHADLEMNESELLADGTMIPVVAQPRNVAVSQYIRNRGGYKNLKRIQAVEMHGSLEVGGQSYRLAISISRPNTVRRSVSVGGRTTVAELAADGQLHIDADVERGLPITLETKLLETFEFDGRLVEWPQKGHEVSMSGMQKIGDALAWKLDFRQSSGQHWNLFINSHDGGMVKADLLDDNNQVEYSILQSDFRETSGFKYAHRIEYVDSNGRSLGVETIHDIVIEKQAFDLVDEAAEH